MAQHRRCTPRRSVEQNGYTYQPGGTPRSVRQPAAPRRRRQRGPAGARPAGLAGLGASEVTLKGALQGRDGYLAMLLGADTKTYIVRPGDRLAGRHDPDDQPRMRWSSSSR